MRGLDHQLVMIRSEARRDDASLVELVMLGIVESDRDALRTGCDDTSAMSATIVLESIPPLRNAPSGTSLIRWLLHGVPSALRAQWRGSPPSGF